MDIPYHKIFNRSIERVILSSLIFQPEFIDEVTSEISEKDFYFEFHQQVYKAIVHIYFSKKIVTEEMIKEYLEKQKKFNESEFLNIFTEMAVTKLEHYIAELKNKSIKRELLNLAKEIENAIFQQDMESDELLNFVEGKVFAIGQNGGGDFKESNEIVEITASYIEKMRQRTNKDLIGINTGFQVLNKMTTGFNAGDLVILAARPSMGKTALALNVVYQAIQDNSGVAFFSLEMPVEQLMLRLLSIDSGIELQKVRTGSLSDNEFSRIHNSLKKFEDKMLFVDDDGGVNINQLRTKLRKLKSKNQNLSLAVVDYIQIMNSAGSKDRQAEISEISRNLKLLARELKIPILALSQLNRALESRTDKRPIMSDIRESGSIELDADIILFVYRDDVYRKKAELEKKSGQNQQQTNEPEKVIVEAELIIAKQRNGPTGTVKLNFHKHLTRFTDYYEDDMRSNNMIQQPTRLNVIEPFNAESNSPEDYDMPQF